METVERQDRELFRLFESNSLKVPSWLITSVQDQFQKGAIGKEARFSVYRTVWSKLKAKGTVSGGRVVYPDTFVACLNSIFPDDNDHKDYGQRTVSLEDIANA